MPVIARGIVPGTIRGTVPLGAGADIGGLIITTIIMQRLTGIMPTDGLPIRVVMQDRALVAVGVVSAADGLPPVHRLVLYLRVRPEAEVPQLLL